VIILYIHVPNTAHQVSDFKSSSESWTCTQLLPVTLCFCSTFTKEKFLRVTKQWTGVPWFHVSDLCWWECNGWSWKLKDLPCQWKGN
jgi:hypothetical protein